MANLLQDILTEGAREFPDREAARFEGRALTYRDLDQMSNQVARVLRAAGSCRGDRVAIYMHKSLASLIAIFGILKAGAAYVPLDPNAPAGRLKYIISDCGVTTITTAPEMLPGLRQMVSVGAEIEVVVLLEHSSGKQSDGLEGADLISWRNVCEESLDEPLSLEVIEQDLAYILYTSGSTGEPKGVMISHRTIFTFLNWCAQTFDLSENDRITSHAPIHFDLSTFDIYVTLMVGATIILVPENLSVFPVQLVKLLKDERVSVTYLVPSVLSMMVNYGSLDKHDLSRLRLVLFAGEVFPMKYLRRLVGALPQAEYYNLYGPTETNVCTYYKVQSPDLKQERTEPVPIGVACANMEVFAVSDTGERVAEPGMEGELWVRGTCIAYGYWGDAEKTAIRFVQNPFQPHFDDRAYRTGDIVRLATDAKNWIYVGRRDHMVKSRGYRIELGEIEAALYAHNGVKESVVVAVPDDIIGNRLKAFVVPVGDDGLTVAALETHCRQLLPTYMIPQHIELLDHLPKTSTGKMDRTTLVARA